MAILVYESSLKRASDGGTGSCTLAVDRLGTPGQYRVVLFNRNTIKPVVRVYSNSSGAVTINDLTTTPNTFFVIAFDTVAGGETPAISDFLVIE